MPISPPSGKVLTISSKVLSSLRPSPSESRRRASVSLRVIFFLLSSTSCSIALVSSAKRSSLLKGFSVYTWQRESKAGITSKLGFSVVAPMRVTHPRSTASSRESCWVLLNRWISSMKIIGLRAVNNPCSRLDFSIISLTSLIPLLMALSEKKARWLSLAII